MFLKFRFGWGPAGREPPPTPPFGCTPEPETTHLLMKGSFSQARDEDINNQTYLEKYIYIYICHVLHTSRDKHFMLKININKIPKEII
jgi:hypothetical protein